ncbi:MAG: hypothetical protein DSZ25_01785 [Thermovibrio sp.]|nr:MAG: hypothetical protein DSZ25_01785 [Thermovibrio sp.]
MSAFVDVDGNNVSLVSYFSDGTPAKNAKVTVYDSNGKVVLMGKTDKEGEFDFKIEKPGKYKVVVNAELGHRAVTTFQIGNLTNENSNSQETSGEEKEQKTEAVSNISEREIRKVIREELRPIHRELLKIEERESSISYKDVIGGLGWIIGIFGAFMFGYCVRRKNGNAL